MKTDPQYRAEYRRAIVNRIVRCACDNRAVAYRRGEAMCQRCIDMMQKDVETRRQAMTGIGRKRNKDHKPQSVTELKWDGELEGFAKTNVFGWGPTEQLLTQLYRVAA